MTAEDVIAAAIMAAGEGKVGHRQSEISSDVEKAGGVVPADGHIAVRSVESDTFCEADRLGEGDGAVEAKAHVAALFDGGAEGGFARGRDDVGSCAGRIGEYQVRRGSSAVVRSCDG